ncbi:oxidoreductase [Bacillus cytotoxicus]|uniref:NAD-dependent epimerase/dehydratase n=1 Tax=Bacillus cytotoxicus (strain DSM 22905 / CIP 110041 / 391-98 / NVH 391-98) TaxID=315749 RepID=A7GNY3_BACCN|nr:MULTISPECIES: oxidoreductase [Bacillus cereus group]ABS21841.1 NAD-dependent epimerase/dehydratase [Bacillus cytotoxicus NVH 391-98]AWC44531.1 oxidoreductase [Bacillus cytotoxicus]MDH2863203.1 oxidoreductase [Bacillus cytotoxicus]MDH2882868.1 oxidoreductase [Bacillus cytotoxicus]MDH2887139.1 oxidoreductase [Bacillus cytotoxicus]
MNKRTALVLGASGLVGQEVTQLLLDSDYYDSVTIFVRKPLQLKHEKLQQKQVDFSILEEYKEFFAVDDVFCCLGTTIKKARTKANFKKVDYEYTLRAACLSEKQGVQNFLVISSMSANSKSVFFYLQVKGKMEEELQKLGIEGIHIFRPSLLLGERKEFRFGERMAGKIFGLLPFIFKGTLKKYKPISAEQVARGMYLAALHEEAVIHIYNSTEITVMK